MTFAGKSAYHVKKGLGFAKLSPAFSGDTFNENMSLPDAARPYWRCISP
jgi:hypothetical protein